MTAVTAVLLLLEGVPSPVAAASSGPSTSRVASRADSRVGADFPTVGQVRAIFPRVREVRAFAGWRPVRLEADCIHVTGTSSRPRRGKRAFYTLADGRDPFDVGLPLPIVTVYRFKAPRQARATLTEIARTFPPCYGTTNDPSGLGNDFAPLRVPRIGKARYGIRNVHRHDGTDVSWQIQLWVVKKQCLVDAAVVRDNRTLRPRQLFALARLAVRSACSNA